MAVTVDTNARLLVTGASGKLGQAIVTHLLDTLKVSPSQIVAASRAPEKLQALADRGVTTRRLDFDDAASVEAAAQGVDRALLISGHDFFSRLSGHKTAVTALVAAGVKHILYTSLHNVDKSTAVAQGDHAATEAFIRESKVAGYTFLRNGLYFENDFGSIAGAKHSGKWYSAAGKGTLAAISRDDLALANAAALASDNYENQIYELSGTDGLTIEEITGNIGKVIGKTIEVVHVSVDGLTQGIVAATGLPEAVAHALASFDGSTAQGFGGPLANDFKTLVGRDPHSHVEWLEANAAVLQAL
jgi:NAD(P)H dehydrogenase (quinone)